MNLQLDLNWSLGSHKIYYTTFVLHHINCLNGTILFYEVVLYGNCSYCCLLTPTVSGKQFSL